MKIIISLLLLIAILSSCDDKENPVPVPDPAPEPPIEETLKYSTGLIKDERPKYGQMFFQPSRAIREEIPSNFSWEDEGFETPVRNQGNCGSCWAFGGTQCLEMATLIFGGKAIDFSEQDLVSTMFYGCGGGYHVWQRQVEKGQMSEVDCPYTASNKKCKKPFVPVAKALSGGYVGEETRRPSDEELQLAIMAYGPLSVTVGANGSFGNYESGFAKGCPSVGTNHIVALTGWKTNPEDGKVYFKIKNSWGEGWGEKGYGYFRAGCWNLAEEASFVIVEKTPCPPPAVKLPAEYVLYHGDTVLLAVKAIEKVTYGWYIGDQKIGDGPQLEFFAEETVVLTLKAKSRCGEAIIKTQITVKEPEIKK